MSDLALKKRLARAKAAAAKALEEKGYVVGEVCPVSADTLLAVDPETCRAKIVHVCLDIISRREAESLSRFAGMTIEMWQRRAGKIGFSVTRTKTLSMSNSPTGSGQNDRSARPK